ncbi:MAG: TAXI family TRAP transporter solute-binding subunit [Deltaproteobacteria bacterium]|nr:TAXI family TRAP transporter solute-binding subunit [Deltaproteobacteria bacterium]
MRKLTLVTVLALALCFVMPASHSVADQKFLRMASGPEGGSWYPLGSAMMSIVQRELGISTSNGPGGGVGNVKVVHGGRADLGWCYTHTTYNGYHGLSEFEGKKFDNIRHLMSLYPGVFQTVVPAKSNIKSYADLKDKRIVPGKTGFTGTAIAELILKAYGLSFDSIRQNGGSVSFVGYADSAALMKDGHSDAYMAVTACPQATIIDLEFRPGVRFLGVSPEFQKKVQELEPGLTPIMIPKQAYKSLEEDVPTMGTVTNIIISKDVPDDVAYKIVKTLYAHWDELKQVKKKDIEDSDPRKALLGNSIPVHPGALKYYKEIGIVN